MNKAVLNSELITTKAGNITVYNFDAETKEYLSTSTEYLAVGVGIPAYSCLDAPGTHKAGYAICRSADFNSWEYGHCCKVSDEAAFCLIQRPYISKTLLTRRISPRGSP